MKDKLPDLNTHLFAQLERLGDEDLSPEEIAVEARRAKAVVGVASQIIKGASLQLEAAQALAKAGVDGQRIRDNFHMIDKPKYPLKIEGQTK